MGYECFDVEVADKVAHLKMIRPDKANSMVPSFWRDLPAIVDEWSASGSVRAMVLSAEGRHFCSGMDLSVFAAGDNGLGTSSTSGHRSRRNERRLLLRPLPSVSHRAINRFQPGHRTQLGWRNR